jgi:hypothetical protein
MSETARPLGSAAIKTNSFKRKQRPSVVTRSSCSLSIFLYGLHTACRSDWSFWITQPASAFFSPCFPLHYNTVFSNSHSTTVLLFFTQSCRNEPTMSQNLLHCHCSFMQLCGTRSRTDEVTLFLGMCSNEETGTWLDKTVNRKAAYESPHHAKVQGAWSWNLTF